MTKRLSPAYRIAAAEAAITDFVLSTKGHSAARGARTARDAIELLRSIDLWAQANGFALRIPRTEQLAVEPAEVVND